MPEPLNRTPGGATVPSSPPSPFTPVPIESFSYGSGFFLKALLIGPGGTGKTIGATTSPGRKLWLDLDGGKESLLGQTGIDVIDFLELDPANPKAFMRVNEVKRWIEAEVKAGTFPYDTVVLDSADRLYAVGMNYVRLLDPARGPGGTPVTTHWLAQKAVCQNFIEFLIHSAFHVVVIVHEAAEKDELLGKISILPSLTGKDAGWISDRFREVYHCYTRIDKDKEGKETITYWWRTQPEPQLPYLKSSMNTMSKYWGPVVEPSFEKLMRIRGVWPEPRAAEPPVPPVV